MSLADLADAARLANATPKQVRERGGPHPNTLNKLLKFKPPAEPWKVRDDTLEAYDAGFGWDAGEARRLYLQPEGPPKLVIDNVDQLADLVARRVVKLLASAQLVVPGLADGAQSWGPSVGGNFAGVARRELG